MDLWQLRTFVAVAKNLNFTRASEELNLTQPAVSHQIKVLETELGDKVFIRNGKTIELTPAGKMFAEYADQVLSTTEDLKKRIENHKEVQAGTVRTGAATRSLDVPFPIVRSEFAKVAPDIDLTFSNFPSAIKILEAVENRDVDIVLTELRPAENGVLRSVPWGLFEIVMIASPDHHLVGAEEISLHRLQHEKWALLDEEDAYGRIVRDLFTKKGINPASIFSTNDGAVIVEMVQSGSHVSMLFNVGVTKAVEEGSLAIIDVPQLKAEMQVYMVWNSENENAALDTFNKFLLEYPLPGMRRRDLEQHPKDRKI